MLAYAATAMPATMDGAGILYEDKDPVRVAALIDQVVTNRNIAAGIVESQDAALDRLLQKDFAGTLLRFVDGDAPLAGATAPANRLRLLGSGHESETLDELRPFRPGAYQALPKAPTTADAAADPRRIPDRRLMAARR